MGLGRKHPETGLQSFCGEKPFTVPEADRQGGKEVVWGARATLYLTACSRSAGWLSLLRGPGNKAQEWGAWHQGAA